MHNNLLNIFIKTFTKPTAAFEELLKREDPLRISIIYISIPIIAYTLMYVFLTIGNGAPSVLTPWLNIPKEDYYYWNQFLLAPGMILSWLFATSVIHIVSRLASGKGTFEQTLGVISLAICVSMYFGLLHDLPMSILSALKIIDARQHEADMNSPTIWRLLLWVFYSAYFIAFLILFPKAVRVVHKLSVPKSIFIGVAGFVLFQIVFLVFNR